MTGRLGALELSATQNSSSYCPQRESRSDHNHLSTTNVLDYINVIPLGMLA